ncbi:response regulator [Bradyrhizobium sp. 930_D9_N1_4]|uniref:response regulator n=1 Tax=Bradyrhizobium sp. 930_D9_N1_4 TaxID=3240374 RepID=UPI003F893E93
MTLSILLVEDEAMIRMMVADMVETLGHEIAAEAGHIDQAMELARSAAYDFAILDMNLNGAMSFPVADTIAARQIPFIFASGYDSARNANQHQQQLVLQKPFTIDGLESAIERALHTEPR